MSDFRIQGLSKINNASVLEINNACLFKELESLKTLGSSEKITEIQHKLGLSQIDNDISAMVLQTPCLHYWKNFDTHTTEESVKIVKNVVKNLKICHLNSRVKVDEKLNEVHPFYRK